MSGGARFFVSTARERCANQGKASWRCLTNGVVSSTIDGRVASARIKASARAIAKQSKGRLLSFHTACARALVTWPALCVVRRLLQSCRNLSGTGRTSSLSYSAKDLGRLLSAAFGEGDI